MNRRMTLGRYVKESRKRLGISQRELSRRTKIDNNTISKIENDTRMKPNILILMKIGIELSLDICELMRLSGYSNKDIDLFKSNIKVKYAN